MHRFLIPVLFLGLAVAGERPNVILMMTDDQGIGDFGVHGNPLIETPNIDAMAKNSGSLTTFYVSPVCSPTRASLMTGRYNQRTRCIDTWLGRSMMDPDEFTLAEALQAAGYRTGLFGKWHLGDCYPMRPQDQGFEEVLMHRGGGLAQPSEPLENERRYTDPILFDEAGAAVRTKGFCTDVYFDAALEFIADGGEEPFFVYLPTNAPHGPYHDVPEELRKHYMEKDLLSLAVPRPQNPKRGAQLQDQLARIAAMITNEDQNVGRLMAHLKKNGLLENTLVIRMNDNGPNTMRYVGEMRGMKSHVHDGGIRSPFWMHWPAKIPAGAKVDVLTAHIDVMPTVLEACGAKAGPNPLDGRSFLGLFTAPGSTKWPDRKLVIQSHRGTSAQKYHHFMLRDRDWKLLHASGFGRDRFEGEPVFELYNLKDDPKEQKNLAGERPEVLSRLKKDYEAWFADVSSTRPNNYAPPRVVIGTEHENPTALTRQDWLGTSWRDGAMGHWVVEVAKPVTADIEVIFHPNVVTNNQVADIALHVGATSYVKKLAGNAMTFSGVELPKGEVRLEAVRRDSEAEVGGYQLIVTCDLAEKSPVRAAVEPFIEAGEISGAVTLVARGGKAVNFEAMGLADLETGRDMRKDDLFWIASMTKPTVGVAIMMLAEEGKLTINDDLEKHLPEFKNAWMVAEKSNREMRLVRPSRKVTLLDVATHTAGIPNVTEPRAHSTLAELVAQTSQRPLEFEPGSRWKYSTAGTNVLGRVVEVVSGQRFEEFVQQRLFDPLGMKDTTFHPSREQAKRLAKSYLKNSATPKLTETGISFVQGDLWDTKRTVKPGGGLFSTAEDMRRFYQMMLDRGMWEGKRILSEESVAALTSTQSGDIKTGFTEGMSWGIKFQVVKEPQGVTAMLNPGTFGHGGAHGTQSWADPVNQTIYVLMIQRRGFPNGDNSDVRKAFQEAAAGL